MDVDDAPPPGPAEAGPQFRHDDTGHSRWLLKITIEMVLISLGVFLALMGEQWRESTHRQAQAEDALRRFRTEIAANRRAVEAVKDYHVVLLSQLKAYVAADPKTRKPNEVQIQGLQPAFFEHTAWDLALATQALADVESDLAFRIARVYDLQATYGALTLSILQTIYLKPLTENVEALVWYYGDIALWEPRLLAMYDDVAPQIDRALGESPTSVGR